MYELVDIVRIDHFRGLEAFWEIPGNAENAIKGKWVKAPGKELFETFQKTFGDIKILAEDLGVITEEVEELRDSFNLPGMKILQFAFGDNGDKNFLPHNHLENCCVYTGSHDNDTTISWAEDEKNFNKEYFEDYCGIKGMSIRQRAWSIIRAALSSVSFLSVIPMQDLLLLGTSARMNIPGTVGGNWSWRFDWEQLNNETINTFSHLLLLYER